MTQVCGTRTGAMLARVLVPYQKQLRLKARIHMHVNTVNKRKEIKEIITEEKGRWRRGQGRIMEAEKKDSKSFWDEEDYLTKFILIRTVKTYLPSKFYQTVAAALLHSPVSIRLHRVHLRRSPAPDGRGCSHVKTASGYYRLFWPSFSRG